MKLAVTYPTLLSLFALLSTAAVIPPHHAEPHSLSEPAGPSKSVGDAQDVARALSDNDVADEDLESEIPQLPEDLDLDTGPQGKRAPPPAQNPPGPHPPKGNDDGLVGLVFKSFQIFPPTELARVPFMNGEQRKRVSATLKSSKALALEVEKIANGRSLQAVKKEGLSGAQKESLRRSLEPVLKDVKAAADADVPFAKGMNAILQKKASEVAKPPPKKPNKQENKEQKKESNNEPNKKPNKEPNRDPDKKSDKEPNKQPKKRDREPVAEETLGEWESYFNEVWRFWQNVWNWDPLDMMINHINAGLALGDSVDFHQDGEVGVVGGIAAFIYWIYTPIFTIGMVLIIFFR